MKPHTPSQLLPGLPSIDDLLRLPEIATPLEREGRAPVVEGLRAIISGLREEISAGIIAHRPALELALKGLPEALERHLRQSLGFSLQPLINATGVILHTNLGRAPISAAALQRIQEIAGGYANLEFDLPEGERGQRDIHLQRLFSRLLGLGETAADAQPAEIQTIVVNNCAAAVLLALNSLAEGGEVIVSRGELVEIGGSFRIPEILAKAGVVLREVGTTNRTRIADYQRAITEKTRLLLRVHRSNFSIVGFTEQPTLKELATLARKRNLPLLEDLGGGALVDLSTFGVTGESTVSDSLRAGADVVTYSGDKLLGGPQAGMLSGRRDLIESIRGNPLFRALRVDKLTYAAMEATLMAYLRHDYQAIPTLRMMSLSAEEIGERAKSLIATVEKTCGDLQPKPALRINLMEGDSLIGGGAAPSATLATKLLAVAREGITASELAARLRQPGEGYLPVVARVEEGQVLFDLRSVFPDQDEALARSIVAALDPKNCHPEQLTPLRGGLRRK